MRSTDATLQALEGELPDGWHVKGMVRANRTKGQRRAGVWYATASGPTSGITGEGPSCSAAVGDLLRKVVAMNRSLL